MLENFISLIADILLTECTCDPWDVGRIADVISA